MIQKSRLIRALQKVYRVLLEPDAIQQFSKGFLGSGFCGLQAHGLRPLVEGFPRERIGFSRISFLKVLANDPVIAFGPVAPRIRGLTGQDAHRQKALQVFGAIVRPHTQPLRGPPNQLLLIISALQVSFYLLLPGRSGHGWKLIKEGGVLFLIHVSIEFSGLMYRVTPTCRMHCPLLLAKSLEAAYLVGGFRRLAYDQNKKQAICGLKSPQKYNKNGNI